MAYEIANEPLTGPLANSTSTNISGGMTIAFLGDETAGATTFDAVGTGAYSAAAGGSGAVSVPAGFKAGSFEDDWYNRVHLNPNPIALGNLLQDQQRSVEVWNAHFVPRTLTAIVESGTEGLTLTRPGSAPTEPAVYGALLLRAYTLNISQQGPPIIDALYEFQFNTPESPTLHVTGDRTVVFPFSSQGPVREELEWATDVHESRDGHEKRVQARLLPRQAFEIQYLSASRQEVANIRNSLIGNIGLLFGVPMWQESRPLLANVAIGATTVTVDTTNADFRAGVGELAILWNSSTSYEVVEVSAVAAGSLTLARPTVNAFTAGLARVSPVRLCYMEDVPTDAAYTVGPATFTIRWKSTQVVDLSEVDGNLTLYLGSPVFTDSNFVEGATIDASYAAKFFEVDSGSGLFTQISRRDVPEMTTYKTWIYDTVAGSFGLRKLLYALRGRQRSFWLPTFKHDFVLAASAGSSATTLEVLPVEYGRFVSEQPPFNHVAIFLNNGTIFFRQITGHGTSGSNETISINTSLGQTVNPSDVKYICYLLRSRIGSDRVQIEHRRLGAVTVKVPVVGVIQ